MEKQREPETQDRRGEPETQSPTLVFEDIDSNEAGTFLALSYEEEPR
jgi:hypothetical protein